MPKHQVHTSYDLRRDLCETGVREDSPLFVVPRTMAWTVVGDWAVCGLCQQTSE